MYPGVPFVPAPVARGKTQANFDDDPQANLMTDPLADNTHAPRADRFALAPREVGMICAFWAGYAVLSVASRFLDRNETSQLAGVAGIAVMEAIAWIALTFGIFYMTWRLDAGRSERGMIAIVVGGVATALALGWLSTQLRMHLTPFVPQQSRMLDSLRSAGVLHDSPMRGRPRTPRGPPIWFGVLNALVLYAGVVAAGLARSYSLRYHRRREEAARREARLEAQLAEARLDSLRRQLDPHFLFNTLNTVSALVERDPRGVRRMISRLSELLRHNFEGGSESEVPLRDELAMLTRYVEIMQVRFQGRLTVETKVDDSVLDALVPSMILQPLVENAIKHGVERMTGPGAIEVAATRANGSVVLRVRDNGPGLDGVSGSDRRGVGIRNSVARLEQLYGSGQRFTLEPHDDGGVVAEVTIPYHVRPVMK